MTNSECNCSVTTEEENEILDDFHNWNGIATIIVSITGIILNIVGIRLIIPRFSTYNIFNYLIVVLFIVDSVCLFQLLIFYLGILMPLNVGWNIKFLTIIYPKFTHPMLQLFVTLSVFITVGISHERYVGIKSSIKHRQKMMSAKFKRIMMLKYLVPITFCAVALNIPKFFEVDLNWVPTKR